MKKILLILTLSITIVSYAQISSKDPWTSEQLMDPAILAQKVENKDLDDILLLSIGFDALIPGSETIGPTEKKANVEKLRAFLTDLPKDQEIVIYCGCCPMDVCPNIRPAFSMLQEMRFKNAKLLNLTTSIKADWMDHDYPVTEK